MKLPLKRTAPVYAPNWHPSFRDSTALPDLKVVRTSFFVNLVCVTVASAGLLFTVFREYTAANIRADIGQKQAQIQDEQAQNGRLLARNREFAEASKKFAEAAAFVRAPVVASDLLAALSRSLPANMDFTSVAYDKEQLTLRGTISGASDDASTRLSAYLDVLRQDALLGAGFPDVSLTSLQRDARTQGLSFEILMRPAPASPAAKRGGRP